jgi:hypothetical protein
MVNRVNGLLQHSTQLAVPPQSQAVPPQSQAVHRQALVDRRLEARRTPGGEQHATLTAGCLATSFL